MERSVQVDLTRKTGPEPMADTRFHRSIESTPLAVRCALADLRRAMPLSGDDSDRVETTLAEVLNNIVEHAYADDPGHRVELWVTQTPRSLVVEVQDTGLPLPDGMLPAGLPTEITGAIDSLPEGGFGWFLIRSLASDLTYRRQNGRNCLFVRFDLTS